MLDYNELVIQNLPQNGQDLTMFNYERLGNKLQSMLKDEFAFYENISQTLMRVGTGSSVLTDTEKQVISLSQPFVLDYAKKLEEMKIRGSLPTAQTDASCLDSEKSELF